MGEEVDRDHDLIQLGLEDYGKYDDALVSLAILVTGNINSGHNLNLELSLEKAKGSTNDNLQRHLSQISLHSQPSQPDTENQTPTHSNLLELNDGEVQSHYSTASLEYDVGGDILQPEPHKPDPTEEGKVSDEVRLDAQMHQEQELSLDRQRMAATELLKENLARQKEENIRTSAWQAEQASIMEEKEARMKQESQELVL